MRPVQVLKRTLAAFPRPFNGFRGGWKEAVVSSTGRGDIGVESNNARPRPVTPQIIA